MMTQNREGEIFSNEQVATAEENAGGDDNNVEVLGKSLKSLALPQTKYVIYLTAGEIPPISSRNPSDEFLHFMHFILDDIRRASLWEPPAPGGATMLRLVASNDGFLCFYGVRGEYSDKTICVHNPTTPNIWNILTLPEALEVLLVGIKFDRKLGACKVIIVGHPRQQKIMRTLLYNAKEKAWQNLSNHEDMFYPRHRRKEAFVFKGLFCWLGWSTKENMYVVIVFDVEKERWEKPILLKEECSKNPLCLVELEEELCIVTEPVKWTLKVWKVYMDIGRPHMFVKDIPLLFCKDEIIEYKFGGKAVLYIGVRQGLWVYDIMHETRRREFIIAVHSEWKRSDVTKRQCHVFKPSLLRFHGNQPGNGSPDMYLYEDDEEFSNMLLDL